MKFFASKTSRAVSKLRSITLPLSFPSSPPGSPTQITCGTCPRIKRFFCIIACPPVNAYLCVIEAASRRSA